MYKVIGIDGQEYGPVTLEQLKEWVAQGRVNAQTRVQPEDATDWTPASQIAELSALFPPPSAAPVRGGAGATWDQARHGAPPPPGSRPQQSMAVTSLVLGICSLLCFGLVTGIPAIICGHMALSRARRAPTEHGGSGFAIAGLVMGYVSVFMTLIVAAMLLPALSHAKSKAQTIMCSNNLKQIGLAFRTWGLDHGDQFVFNVSTNSGGTLELCARQPSGFDANAAVHFQVMSNELSGTPVLICPADSKKAAANFQTLQAIHISYNLRTGENVDPTNTAEVLAVCPIHNNVLRADGSVEIKKRSRRVR